MWKLLNTLVSSFLLLRDFFGYLIPGGVIVAVLLNFGAADFVRQTASLLPAWGVVVVVVAGAYLAGHILVAIGFAIYGFVDTIFPRRQTLPSESELLYYRLIYPPLFAERDRRATINIMRIGVAIALLAGAWFFPWPIRAAALILGLLLLYNGYTGARHVMSYGAATLEAARKAERKRVPRFPWGGEKE